jgi:hypothetical protein
MKTAQLELTEDREIADLRMNRVYHVCIPSLELNEDMYFFERSRVGWAFSHDEEPYDHLALLTKPSGKKSCTFYVSVDARFVQIHGNTISEKIPFILSRCRDRSSIKEVTDERGLRSRMNKVKTAFAAYGGKS